MQEGKVLNVFYQLGLIFLMFSSGYNTKINLNKKNVKVFTTLFIGSTMVPMLLGIPFINMFKKFFIGNKGVDATFTIVFLSCICFRSSGNYSSIKVIYQDG